MSTQVKSKNMSNIRRQLWYKKMRYYIISVMNIPKGSQRFTYSKEMFEFMMGDLWWINDNNNKELIKAIKEKLIELNEDITMTQSIKEYLRNVEEAFGFVAYCCSNTGKYRCENTIIKGEKNNYCKLHKKILEIKSDRISQVIGSSDVSMLIAQYI
jgi:hypothetical protein